MPRVEVTTTEPEGPVAKGLLSDFDHLMQSIRTRAYQLFERRGRKDGADVEDWLCAEEELLFPLKIETKQEPGRYTLRLSVPGFSATDLKVYTIGNSLIIKGAMSKKSEDNGVSREQNRSVFYQWPMPDGARSEEIRADYKQEGLTINIPVEGQPKPVQIQASDFRDSSAVSAAA